MPRKRGERALSDDDYRRLLEFRISVRKFLSYSKEQAESVGLTPTQHQLLLAVRGHPEPGGPTIGDVAECLMVKHHSAVELIDRSAKAGLIERRPDPRDQRAVRLVLTRTGRAKLERISRANLAEIARLDDEYPEVRLAVEAERALTRRSSNDAS